MVKPVFIFSLPRSGSTLVQRVLGACDAVSTVSEPWVLLSLLANSSPNGTYARYYHGRVVRGVEDFISQLPRGKESYDEALRNFALDLYSRAASENSTYFLDKTPRYHTVSHKIIELFPDGKFVFLWRNPLSVISSMIETWGEGKWNLYLLKVDLFLGLEQLVQTYEKYEGKVWSLRYEDLVTDENSWVELFRYLDLRYDKSLLSSFSRVELGGRYGDKTGVKEYDEISSDPLTKWTKTIQNPIRKWWVRRYLKWIGARRLETMGYNIQGLLGELDKVQVSFEYALSDLGRITVGGIRPWVEPRMLIDKLRCLPNANKIVEHK